MRTGQRIACEQGLGGGATLRLPPVACAVGGDHEEQHCRGKGRCVGRRGARKAVGGAGLVLEEIRARLSRGPVQNRPRQHRPAISWSLGRSCREGQRAGPHGGGDRPVCAVAVPGSVAMEASSDGEEDAEGTDKVTETVMNGGMKETLSLTVDAKTETAVFKR